MPDKLIVLYFGELGQTIVLKCLFGATDPGDPVVSAYPYSSRAVYSHGMYSRAGDILGSAEGPVPVICRIFYGVIIVIYDHHSGAVRCVKPFVPCFIYEQSVGGMRQC